MPATRKRRRSAPASVLLALSLAASSAAIAPTAHAATVPDAPTNVVAAGGDGRASVDWTAPAADGGSPITGYVVHVSPDGFSVPTGGTENWADIDGLTNGRAYTFTVSAVNAVGSGPASAPSSAVVPSPPLGPPGAPRMVTAAAGDAIASVGWLPPTWDGGEPITQYVVVGYDISGGGAIFVGSVAVPPTQLSASFELCNCGMDAYVFHVVAENVHGQSPWSAASTPVVPRAGAPAPQTATALISTSGGTATTDPDGLGPSPSNPVTTTVTVPATSDGGTVSIAESAVGVAPTGFAFLGQQVDIVSTAATDSANPLMIVFHVDPSLVPVTIFRNGLPVEAACEAAGSATTSPCIAAGAGTATITILTAAASTWNIGLRVYDFSGFFSPVNSAPVVNSTKAGSAIPIKFDLGGDRGLNVLAAGFPKVLKVTCDTSMPLDEIEVVLSPGHSLLSYDAVTSRYTYVWKTDVAWARTCRQLVMRLADGTEHRASFTFRK